MSSLDHSLNSCCAKANTKGLFSIWDLVSGPRLYYTDIQASTPWWVSVIVCVRTLSYPVGGGQFHVSSVWSHGRVRVKIISSLQCRLWSKLTKKNSPTRLVRSINTHRMVTMTPAFSSMLLSWAMKTAATHWNMAAPSMLTVAPMGRMKRLMRLSTPLFSSTHFIMEGRVAELEREGERERRELFTKNALIPLAAYFGTKWSLLKVNAWIEL